MNLNTVVTFKSKETGKVYTEFIPYYKTYSQRSRLKCWDESKYEVLSTEVGDREFYLNKKLDFRVEEYLDISQDIEKTVECLYKGLYRFEVGLKMLNQYYSLLKATERSITILINEMDKKGYAILNEQAICIYNVLLSDIPKKRGANNDKIL